MYSARGNESENTFGLTVTTINHIQWFKLVNIIDLSFQSKDLYLMSLNLELLRKKPSKTRRFQTEMHEFHSEHFNVHLNLRISMRISNEMHTKMLKCTLKFVLVETLHRNIIPAKWY